MESTLDPIAAGKSDQIWGTAFSRRIEFHLARKPFTGFGNGSGGFHLETLNPSSNSALATGMTPAPGNPQLKKIGGDFDQELSLDMTFRKIMRIGAGLQNLGNTCYLNAVLQCLTYTEPLAAYLESGKHQNSCRKAGFCALCAIQKHVTHALQATGRILAPKDLVSNLRCISRNFRNSRQEDAHEYMVNLLESMHKCCLPSGIPSESPSAYEKSLVHRIFGGRLRSRVKCMQCSYCSDKLDPFLDISLEIIKADSLYKALERFTAQELLDGGEKQYNCQQCKQKVRACKQLTIDNAPNVLTIHLKRFGSHLTGQKIVKKIHYGPVLDLNRFMSNPHTGDLKYTLYGVLVHAGWSTHSGHYYCFVRTSSGMWYSLDDNQVFQVSEKMVLDQKAYMLFYVRDRKSNLPKKPHVDVVHNKDTNSINGIRNQERECDPTNGASSIQRDTLNITTSPKEASSQAVVSLEANSLLQKVIVSESSPLVVPTRDMNKDDSSGDTCTNMPVARKSIPLNEANGKATLKVRKKPFKPHIMFVRLSSIIFGTALRKRKHKLRKHMISHKNLSLEYTNKQHFLPALGQPDTNKENKSDGVESKSDGVESNGLTDQKQSGLMNMLTRGLEETRVACWDGIQSYSAVGGARNEYANIGYIGDEWDEQYDQGKRKKVRSSKLDFGGPNPFQEIASTKANLKKKAKLGHYRSANQPFRI